MKTNSFSPEEEAELTLLSLDKMEPAAVPSGFDERFFARLDAALNPFISASLKVKNVSEIVFVAKTPRWFWAAAVALLLVNGIIAFNYLQSAAPVSGLASENQLYFQGGVAWF